jgi:hypothetical protein
MSQRRALTRLAGVIEIFANDSNGEYCPSTLLGRPVIDDEFVTVGESKAGAEYREHVVPRIMLVNEACRMYLDGCTVQEVTDLLEKYLKVVLITKGEADRLDLKENLGLKKMPEEWSFKDGDEFAGLHAANIEFTLYE